MHVTVGFMCFVSFTLNYLYCSVEYAFRIRVMLRAYTCMITMSILLKCRQHLLVLVSFLELYGN